MSVAYYDCSCCGNNGVYEEYIAHCCECGALVCSGDKISHKQIVRYLCNKYNLLEEDVIKEILNERRNDS